MCLCLQWTLSINNMKMNLKLNATFLCRHRCVSCDNIFFNTKLLSPKQTQHNTCHCTSSNSISSINPTPFLHTKFNHFNHLLSITHFIFLFPTFYFHILSHLSSHLHQNLTTRMRPYIIY